MATYNKFQSWVEFMVEGANVGSDSFKVYLSNTTPNAATMVNFADLAEIAAGNGYTAGGNAAATSSSAQTAGVFKLTLADPATWTASGGNIGPFRYIVLYDDTLAGDPLVGWWDNSSSITLLGANGDTFDVLLDASGGVFTNT